MFDGQLTWTCLFVLLPQKKKEKERKMQTGKRERKNFWESEREKKRCSGRSELG